MPSRFNELNRKWAKSPSESIKQANGLIGISYRFVMKDNRSRLGAHRRELCKPYRNRKAKCLNLVRDYNILSIDLDSKSRRIARF
jgi:hypothetical protein